MRLATAGFTLHSVTASGEEEAEALLAFRAAMPKDLLEVVSQHKLLFQPSDAQPPEREVTHQIVLAQNAIPNRRTPYPLSGTKLDVMHTQVRELIGKGWVRPSVSPWASPILFVQKDGGSKLRLCIDYRDVNALTTKDAFPLPRLDLALHRAAKAKVFSKLDLASGFHQILVHPAHREITAFVLLKPVQGSSFWEWTVMLFGLVNAPATFQRAMLFALRGCEDCAIVYIDDILIYSDSREDHLRHLDRVFACLQGQAYHIRLAKYQFLQATVTFLGHRITAQGIEASAAREETLEAFTTPLTRAKHVKSFLGLVMWYKAFIPHAATLAEPLFMLTSTKKAFAWTSAAEEAVTALKQAIVRAPVLARYDPALPTRVTTDASTVGIGAVLEQRQGGAWRPVAFWSRKLKDAETRYSATDLEWLAVVDAVTLVWRHFLEDLSFTLCTDHQALERKLHKSAHDPPVSARQARWIEQLMPFALRYEYIKGVENVVADALSRHLRAHLNTATVISAQLAGLLQRMVMASEQDEAYTDLKRKIERGEVPGYRLCRGLVQATEGEIVVPRDDVIRTFLLAEAHDSRMGGHFGGARTLEKIRRLWTWKGMAKDVTDYVWLCPKCQATRIDT